MMPPLRSFDDLDGKERGQKKTDDLRAMTTLGLRTLVFYCALEVYNIKSLKNQGLFFYFDFGCRTFKESNATINMITPVTIGNACHNWI